jgi:hypothetical protein
MRTFTPLFESDSYGQKLASAGFAIEPAHLKLLTNLLTVGKNSIRQIFVERAKSCRKICQDIVPRPLLPRAYLRMIIYIKASV